jgi:RNA polymerase sigma factor (sigma-70 family)
LSNKIKYLESDQELWERVLNSHAPSLDAIYFRYVDDLFDYGMKIVRNESIIQDTIQDIFVDLWNKRKTLNSIEYLKTYLLVALKRRLIRKVERQKRSSSISDMAMESSVEFNLKLITEPEIFKEHDEADRKHKIQTALNKLTPKQREVIFLKYYQHHSYLEISDILEVETKAVYKLMARALDGLKENISLSILLSMLPFLR